MAINKISYQLIPYLTHTTNFQQIKILQVSFSIHTLSAQLMSNIQGSRYYADNKYLNTIFQKQQRMGKPIETQQTDTPFHFLKKNMDEQSKKQLLQKKIFDNPQLYMSTHVKCQICNKYIETEMVDHHSRIHFQQEERIAKILQKNSGL